MFMLILPTEVIRFGKLFFLKPSKSCPFWKIVTGCKGTKIPQITKQIQSKKTIKSIKW
jgi:hypothetical protein